MARLQAQAGGSGSGTGSAQAKGTHGGGQAARSRGGPSAGYAAKVRAKVRPNIIYNDYDRDNPRTDIEVRAAPDGTIIGRRIVRPSGIKAWDQAALRAVDRTRTLPKDVDGSVPATIVLELRPG